MQFLSNHTAIRTGLLPKGRGAGFNPHNRFEQWKLSTAETSGIDPCEAPSNRTRYIERPCQAIVNQVTSPDIPFSYSMNPYAGCEHGCIYCYARNTHEYLGLSAGLDFEQQILVKTNAPEKLETFLQKKNWDASTIMLSGNTDCYQPAEQHYQLTRRLLEICNRYQQPVGIITKNALVLRDTDLLQEMAARRLTSVLVTITTLNEPLRRRMEPRTTTAAQRLHIIEKLSKAGVHCGVMIGPVIPGLNDQELPQILQQAARAGARFSSYTYVRLNGAVQLLFKEWLHRNVPDRAAKIWNLISDGHGGQVNDSRFGKRMRGEGAMAGILAQQFKKQSALYQLNQSDWEFDHSRFRVPENQLRLFE